MKIKNILWDFDGVILDSMKVRDWGFREIFKEFKEKDVENLIDYHRENGGLSRYVKIRYFFNDILKREISDELVLEYANSFSFLMKRELVNKNNLILETFEFIKLKYKDYNFHIVSGSDQNELRFLCEKLDLASYFISIHGSPTPKTQLVEDVLKSFNYNIYDTILIGDSKNDLEASQKNSIRFMGYNNTMLIDESEYYIDNFIDFLNFIN